MTTGLDGDVRRDVNKIPVFFQGMVPRTRDEVILPSIGRKVSDQVDAREALRSKSLQSLQARAEGALRTSGLMRRWLQMAPEAGEAPRAEGIM